MVEELDLVADKASQVSVRLGNTRKVRNDPFGTHWQYNYHDNGLAIMTETKETMDVYGTLVDATHRVVVTCGGNVVLERDNSGTRTYIAQSGGDNWEEVLGYIHEQSQN